MIQSHHILSENINFMYDYTELKASGRYFIQDIISYGRLFIGSKFILVQRVCFSVWTGIDWARLECIKSIPYLHFLYFLKLHPMLCRTTLLCDIIHLEDLVAILFLFQLSFRPASMLFSKMC